MRYSLRLIPIFLLMILCTVSVRGQRTLIYDDLNKATKGQIIGAGSFMPAGGWRSSGGKIVFNAGRGISRGYFEAKMRGWTAPAQGITKTHPLSGWEYPNQYTRTSQRGSYWNWRIGLNYNPFKVLAKDFAEGTRHEERVGSNAAVNDGETHTYRVEWNSNWVAFYFDDQELTALPMSRCQLQYFTIGKDDNYSISSPAPIILDIVVVDFDLPPVPALSIVDSALSEAVYGHFFSDTIMTEGGLAPLQWELVAGFLPDSCVMDEETGTVSGIPVQSGEFIFTAAVFDQSAVTKSDTASIIFNVHNDAPVILSTDSISVQFDQFLLYHPAASDPNTNPVEFLLGKHPVWMTLSDSTVTGTPGFGAQDTSFVLIATDGDMQDSIEVHIKVKYPDLILSGQILAQGLYLRMFSDTLHAQGGQPPYQWDLISGTLPPGLALNADGVISGVPAASGIFQFGVSVQDQCVPPKSVTAQLFLEIKNNAPVFVSSDTISVQPGDYLIYKPEAADDDGHEIAFLLIESPVWITWEEEVVFGFPQEGTQDTLFVITATDGEMTDTLTVQVKIRGTSGIGPVMERKIPGRFDLMQNYPNPFNGSTRIKYALPEDNRIRLDVFDICGNLVETLIEGRQKAGYHSVVCHSDRIPSGMYIYRLVSKHEVRIRKMMVLK